VSPGSLGNRDLRAVLRLLSPAGEPVASADLTDRGIILAFRIPWAGPEGSLLWYLCRIPRRSCGPQPAYGRSLGKPSAVACWAIGTTAS